MNRREALTWLVAIALTGNREFVNARVSETKIDLLIDIHCHIFNAQDLPVSSFVRKILLQEYCGICEEKLEERGYEEFYRRAIGILVNAAPSFEKEKRALSAIKYIDEDVISSQKTITGSESSVDVEDEFGKLIGRATLDKKPLQGDSYIEGLRDYSNNGIPTFGLARRFLKKLTRFRFENVLEYQSLFHHSHRSTLICPQIVDYSTWLQQEPRTTLEEQFQLAEIIQRKTRRIHVHHFAPFDPARIVMEDEGSYFELLEHYVMENGFAGVKLYPPMGFYPLGNTNQPVDFFPKHLSSKSFGKALDNSLNKLYVWAEKHGVPLLAHSAHTNAPSKQVAGAADPKNWEPVFKHYPALRICLAHFGGDNRSVLTSAKSTKDVRILELFEKYSNVFADVSYFESLLKSSIGPQIQGAAFAEPFRRNKFAKDKLLFGTDWLMLALEKNHDEFEQRVREWQASADSNWTSRSLFSDNAKIFLGLGEGKVIQRYQSYYIKTGRDFDDFQRKYGATS